MSRCTPRKGDGRPSIFFLALFQGPISDIPRCIPEFFQAVPAAALASMRGEGQVGDKELVFKRLYKQFPRHCCRVKPFLLSPNYACGTIKKIVRDFFLHFEGISSENFHHPSSHAASVPQIPGLEVAVSSPMDWHSNTTFPGKMRKPGASDCISKEYILGRKIAQSRSFWAFLFRRCCSFLALLIWEGPA